MLLTTYRREGEKIIGLESRTLQRGDGHRLDSIQGHTVSRALVIKFHPRGTTPARWHPIIKTNNRPGKRKALEKKAGVPSSSTTGTSNQPEEEEAAVECWDISQQSVSTIPASLIKQFHDPKVPLLAHNKAIERRQNQQQQEYTLI